MGAITSKLFNSSTDSPKSVKKSNVVLNDPRSPTVGLDRTPIVVTGEKKYLETNFDLTDVPTTSVRSYNAKPWPLNKRIYKNLGIDPKTAEYFVPGSVPMNFETFNSPVSTYSYNVSEIDEIDDITEPAEPSAVVSDFEPDLDASDYQEMFLQQIDNLITKLTVNNDKSSEEDVVSVVSHSSVEKIQPEQKQDEPLDITNPSKTQTPLEEIENKIMKDLELIEAETEHIQEKPVKIQKVIKPRSTRVKQLKNNKIKVQKRNVDIENFNVTPPLSGLSKIPINVKSRTPLGNITSSANSPVQILKVKNTKLIEKMNMPDVENIKKPVICQWDQDNTLVI